MDENEKIKKEFIYFLLKQEINRREKIFLSQIKKFSSSEKEEKDFIKIAEEEGFEIIF